MSITGHDGRSASGADPAPVVRHHAVVAPVDPNQVEYIDVCGRPLDGQTTPGATVVYITGPMLCDPAAAAAPEAVRARAYAVDYVRSLAMPVPGPVISAPNGGICGAVHSLALGIEPRASFTDPDTPFGPLVVHVTGTFVVDWGDGSSGSYSTAGAPWPNTEISHSWAVSRHYDITVTATWTADWTFGGYSGVVAGLTTTGAIRNWPVMEAQAVLVR